MANQNILKKIELTTSQAVMYNIGHNIGGLTSIVGSAFQSPSDLELKRVEVVCKEKPTLPLNIHLFADGLSGNTSFTNNVFWSLDYFDAKKLIATIPIAAADYVTTGAGQVAQYTGNPIPIVTESGVGAIYAAVEAKGFGGFSSTQSLALNLLFS